MLIGELVAATLVLRRQLLLLSSFFAAYWTWLYPTTIIPATQSCVAFRWESSYFNVVKPGLFFSFLLRSSSLIVNRVCFVTLVANICKILRYAFSISIWAKWETHIGWKSTKKSHLNVHIQNEIAPKEVGEVISVIVPLPNPLWYFPSLISLAK